jgi:hypothetical protein
MQSKNNSKCLTVTMVSPQQIATMRYPGCTTPQAVTNFCSKHQINRFWWKPMQGTGTGKVLMIDLQNFRTCWKEWKGASTTGTTNYNNRSTRTSSSVKSPTTNRKTTTLKAKTYGTSRTRKTTGTKTTKRTTRTRRAA